MFRPEPEERPDVVATGPGRAEAADVDAVGGDAPHLNRRNGVELTVNLPHRSLSCPGVFPGYGHREQPDWHRHDGEENGFSVPRHPAASDSVIQTR